MKKTKKKGSRWASRLGGSVKRLARSLGQALSPLRGLRWQNFLMLLGAGLINAVGVTLFLAPVRLYDGGISGTAMFLGGLTGLGLPVFLLILNIPLFLFGIRKQGPVFTVYSLWAVLAYSAASFVLTRTVPMEAASPFAGTDLLLCAIFGGMISGVGSGLTIRFGGAIDGMEVLAVTFAKGLGLTVGTFMMIYNVAQYVVIGVTLHSWILPLYSIVAYFVGNKTVDFIVEGLDRAKSVMIVTAREEAV